MRQEYPGEAHGAVGIFPDEIMDIPAMLHHHGATPLLSALEASLLPMKRSTGAPVPARAMDLRGPRRSLQHCLHSAAADQRGGPGGPRSRRERRGGRMQRRVLCPAGVQEVPSYQAALLHDR